MIYSFLLSSHKYVASTSAFIKAINFNGTISAIPHQSREA
jgi:hypothetical protein